MAKKGREKMNSCQRCIKIFKDTCANIGDERLQSNYLGERRRWRVMEAIRGLKEEIKDENR